MDSLKTMWEQLKAKKGPAAAGLAVVAVVFLAWFFGVAPEEAWAWVQQLLGR